MPAVLNPQRTLPRPDDPAILATVCAAVRHGHSIRATAALAGIAKTTLVDWLAQGRRDLQQAQQDGREPGSHARFASRVESAYAEFEAGNLGYIREARSPDAKGWIPAMALLRSRHPEEWVENRAPSILIDRSQQSRKIAVGVVGRLVMIDDLSE